MTFVVERSEVGWMVSGSFSKFSVIHVAYLSDVPEAIFRLWEEHLA